MRGKKWSWSEKILFLTPLLFIFAANWTFFVPRDRVFRADILNRAIDDRNPFRAHGSNCGRGNNCQSHLKYIGLGFLQYAQDNDEKLPPVATSGKFHVGRCNLSLHQIPADFSLSASPHEADLFASKSRLHQLLFQRPVERPKSGREQRESTGFIGRRRRRPRLQ